MIFIQAVRPLKYLYSFTHTQMHTWSHCRTHAVEGPFSQHL